MLCVEYLCIWSYCVLQVLFIALSNNRRHNVRSGQERYFQRMLTVLLFSFIANLLSSFQNSPDWLFPIAAAGNYFEIILNAVLVPLYFNFICEQMNTPNIAVCRRIRRLLWLLVAICAGMAISTAFNGKFFYFDENRMYHRGPLFLLPMSIFFIMMVIVEGFVIRHKDKIEAPYYQSLAFFILFPMIGWALQSFIYGLPFSLMGITFAAFIVYINIQYRNIDKDYLTGAFNRHALDSYIQHKINSSQPFSAILLDIDNFKQINDSFGHYCGDMALIDSVKILRKAAARADYIARYGGDEFCIVFDHADIDSAKSKMQEINRQVMHYNQNSKTAYRLQYSMGYAPYDASNGNTAMSFLKVVDEKMYQVKNAQRGII